MQRDIDEVEALLDIWVEYMRISKYPVSGYATEANCFINSWQKDFEELCEGADSELVIRIDAAYDSLSRRYQDPILQHYSLGHHVWRFGHPATFEEAKQAIRQKFIAKGLL